MNEKIVKYLLVVLIIIVGFQLILFLWNSTKFVHKHFLLKEKNLAKRYGENSYVIITGASSGQGQQFAYEFAKRGFNLILIGSERTANTINYIHKNISPSTKIVFIKKDFRKAHQPMFFDDIEEEIQKIDDNISGLVNNVAYRVGWNPYHNMPEELINDSIIVGTIVQAQLTRICIKYFLERKTKNFIVNITAQCMTPTYLFGNYENGIISVPFLSVYEAANAFGFYHGNSIHKEYSSFTDKIDIMNVMPGAVITENTEYLADTIFSVKADIFVSNIMRQLGTYNGNTYGYWGHEFTILLVNIFPFIKKRILYNVGYTISDNYMNTPKKKY